MTTPQYEVYPYQWMGLLWIYYDTGTRWIWAHDGGGSGISTVYAFCPEESSAVIVLTNGESFWSGTYVIMNALFDYVQEYGVEEFEPSEPVATVLQISPNPFRDRVNITFNIEHGAKSIELKIYDATGRLVKSFRPTPDALRSTQISWDGTDQANRQLPSGVYFVKFQAGGYTETKKLLLIK
jgi:hypothetical protein